MKKNQFILTVSIQLENVPLNIKSYRFECNDCNVCSQLRLIILLSGFRERLTQENCFLFCKKYGLFNGFIFLTIKKFLLFYFPNFHGQRSGGGGGGRHFSISYLKQNFSAMERVSSRNLYTNSFTRNEL